MTSAHRSYQPHDNGVFAAPAHTGALRARFCREGGDWRAVDLSPVSDKAGLLSAVATALDFPPQFGRNWDALADSLEDLSWLAASGVVIELAGAGRFAHAAPEAWRTALDIFERAASYWRERGKTFVVLAHGAAGMRNPEA